MRSKRRQQEEATAGTLADEADGERNRRQDRQASPRGPGLRYEQFVDQAGCRQRREQRNGKDGSRTSGGDHPLWLVAIRAAPGDPSWPRVHVVSEPELVVLLDQKRQPVGTMPKTDVHGEQTPLHLAFSCYVFDGAGRFLLTRRALTKRTWPGVWTNSCCGHPAPGERVEEAAARRLKTELGLVPASLRILLPNFSYQAKDASGVVENEVCPVLVCRVDGDPQPDPDEVAEWRWVDWPDFVGVAVTAPWLVSPWVAQQVPSLREHPDLPSGGAQPGKGTARRLR